MGRELIIDGEAQEYEEDTTIAELKEEAGIPIDDIVRFKDGDEEGTVSNKDTVDSIPDGSQVFSQPAKGEVFG